MGSGQSSTGGAGAPTAHRVSNNVLGSTNASDDKVTHDHTNNNNSEENHPQKQRLIRTGIFAVNYRCRKKKAAYDKCVSKWYNQRFLQGKSINQEEECGELFEIQKQCYLKGIKREFFDKQNKTPKEGSLLAEELDITERNKN